MILSFSMKNSLKIIDLIFDLNCIIPFFDCSNRTREGVSFQGFYYISFHQQTGNIHGMYFAENSEQYSSVS